MSGIALLNGPNLNLLGKREPGIYGDGTLSDIEKTLEKMVHSFDKGIAFESFQSNHEGELIDFIHRVSDQGFDYVIFNPGAFTHTSVALRDAIAGTGLQVVEVHISNIHKREEFRHKSFIAPVAVGQISGFGKYSYVMALNYILEMIGK